MIDKEAVKKELELIVKKEGSLSPHKVVEFAKDKKTALHEYFEWDDTEAAQQWRIHQARMLIRVVVTIIPFEGKEIECREYVSLRSERQEGIGYRPMISVLKHEDLRKELLEDAYEEMRYFRDKYRGLKELEEVVLVMEKTLKGRSQKFLDRSVSSQLRV